MISEFDRVKHVFYITRLIIKGTLQTVSTNRDQAWLD